MITNINDDRFRQELAKEMPGIGWQIDNRTDMLDLRFTLQVTSGIELFPDTESAYEYVRVLAERLRQDALVKTGADRQVRAANEQADQYRRYNDRLVAILLSKNQEITRLKERIESLEDILEESL